MEIDIDGCPRSFMAIRTGLTRLIKSRKRIDLSTVSPSEQTERADGRMVGGKRIKTRDPVQSFPYTMCMEQDQHTE